MKTVSRLWMLLVSLMLAGTARANLYTVTGTADGTGTVTQVSGTNYSATTLRAAANAANAAGGVNVINVPAGTYSLTLGEVQLGVASGTTITLNGTGTAANTIIQHDTTTAAARVFDVDINLAGNIKVTFLNVTIAHGRNADGNGGAGVVCGFQNPADTTVFNNCVFTDNQVLGATSDAVGGGIQNIGGTLTVSNCMFFQNSATNFSGGAIYYDSHSPSIGTCTILSSLFSNNVSGDLADGGGAVFISGVTNSTLTISNCVFLGNSVTSASGSGGAILKNGGALMTVTGCTFLTNRVTGTTAALGSAAGGAMDAAGGAVLLQYCRLYGNLASQPTHGNTVNSTAISPNSFVAISDWWGVNTGPSATDLVGATAASWLKLAHYANPASIPIHGSTTLTASFVTNSAGIALSPSLLGTVIGLPIVFNNAVSGTLSSMQTAIQSSATATAVFTHTGGIPASANATVDGATVTAIVNIQCIAATAFLSGGTSICPGNSATLTVSISGGVPPYSVTLVGGGGTTNKIGASPMQFTFTPAATATYSISSVVDSNGCGATIGGSATITVNPASPPVITLTPAVISSGSAGNIASGPAGMAGYGWSISNGTIIGASNQSSITFTAGKYNSLGLSLMITNTTGCTNSSSLIVPIQVIPVVSLGCDLRTNYFNSLSFTDYLLTHPAGMAFDGTNYWACSGAGASGVRFGEYSQTGTLIASYSPGLDFRSIFTDSTGTVYARAINSGVIYRQTSPGVLTSYVTLTGGSLDSQAQVVLNGSGTAYLSMNLGTVYSWDLNGNYLGSVALQGYGNATAENTYPQNRAMGVVGEFWVTYNTNGSVLSIWETNGVRIGQTTLSSAGKTFDSQFGLSYCNGKVFIADVSGGAWRAYDVCDGARVAIYGAPNTAAWNNDVQTKILAVGAIPQVDAFLATSGNPVPGVVDFEKYESVLLYSDSIGFNDAVTIGNGLSNYVALGGGVTVSSLAYSAGFGLGGGITNGELPFTSGSSLNTGLQSLVANIPSHPLLDGVSNFNGGSSSYRNSPLGTNAGAVLVAHWSDGQPLVGGKDVPPGRTASLNFYPASSDARSDFWTDTTDGDRLMSDALLWTGKIPPTISIAPANQYLPAGKLVTFTVKALGSPPLTYQWRYNGSNILNATNSAYSFIAQTGNEGVYRAVVSNSYGASFSPAAMLNPGLGFLKPVLSGNALPLYLANTDGSAITPTFAAHIQIYYSTNLATPKSSWTLMNNPMVLTSGMLRIDGVQVTNRNTYFVAKILP